MRSMTRALCVLLAVFFAFPAFATLEPDDSDRDSRRDRALRRLRENDRALDRRAENLDRSQLPEIDASLIAEYTDIITYLADPEREGRAPGTQGIEDAAAYLVERFAALGLTPAFEDNTSYRQTMEMGVSLDASTATLTIAGDEMTESVDFAPLAYSATASATGPVTFAGYAIVSGPDAYTSFPTGTEFDGAIVMCLKNEPQNPDGSSKWRDDGWSHHARMTYKVNALQRRGAGAVMIVASESPMDPMNGVLDNLESTSPPQLTPGVTRGPEFDIPVISITPELARAIVEASGTTRSFDELVAAANEGPIIQRLPIDASVDVEIQRTPTLTDNLGAILPGKGALADEYIVIGAHYDHVGYGRFGSRIRNAAGQIHPGADDNASGTTGILISARELSNRYALLADSDNARSVLFLLFTAEESGLNGSRYYVDNPIAPLEQHEIMLNMDMIGSLEQDPLEVGGFESSGALETLAQRHLDDSGLVYAHDTSVGSGRSDHASFEAKDIPNLFFFTGLHDRYHTPDDTLDFVDEEGAVRVATIVAQIAFDAATDTSGFPHTDDNSNVATNEPPKVRVGIVPSNVAGQGMRVLRIFDNTSASEAGLESGDLITHWDGDPIESVESWSPILLKHKPGDIVTLTVVRAGEDEPLELEMTLKPAQ